MVVVVVVGGQWAISETRRPTSTYAGREWLAGAAKVVATCPAWQLPASLCAATLRQEARDEQGTSGRLTFWCEHHQFWDESIVPLPPAPGASSSPRPFSCYQTHLHHTRTATGLDH